MCSVLIALGQSCRISCIRRNKKSTENPPRLSYCRAASVNPARRQNHLVVISVKLAGRNLHSAAKGKPRPRFRIIRMQLQLAEKNTRRDELLHLAVVRPALVPRGVAL